MKRKTLILLGLLLALSGCGQKQVPPTQGPEPAGQAQNVPAQEEQATPSAGDRNPTAAELDREETTELTFLLEGLEETVPATLYAGQGYSLYIPDEGWRLERDTEDGVPVDTWESVYNDDVELQVLHLGERTLEEAQAWVQAEEDDYQLTEDKQGGLAGMDHEDRQVLEVRFFQAGAEQYAVLYTYPANAAEGFGARLGQIADTFETAK